MYILTKFAKIFSFSKDTTNHPDDSLPSQKCKVLLSAIFVILLLFFGFILAYFIITQINKEKEELCTPSSEVPENFEFTPKFKNVNQHRHYQSALKLPCGNGENSIGGIFFNSEPHCNVIKISTRSMITARHCVGDEEGSMGVNFSLKFGCTDATCSNPSLEINGKNLHVVHLFKNYSDINKMHDIAVIKVNEEINFDNIEPACLPLGDENVPERLLHRTFNRSVNKKNMSLILNEDCIERHKAEYYNCSFAAPITHHHICAGVRHENGKISGTVRGESGSPLFAQIGNKNILVGITSWGSESELDPKPSAFTHVKTYLERILDHFD